MSERTYVIGLPVIITINEDGTVTYEVDTSEAGQGIREDDLVGGSEYDEPQREADSRIIEADPDRPKVTHTLPEADDVPVTATCRHCGRGIGFNEPEGWVDTEATGDDYIWRVTCADNHEDRIAAHEPVSESVQCGETWNGQRCTQPEDATHTHDWDQDGWVDGLLQFWDANSRTWMAFNDERDVANTESNRIIAERKAQEGS